MAQELKVNKSTYIYGLLVLAVIISIAVALLLIRPLMNDNKSKQAIIDQKKKNLSTLEEKKSKLEELSLKSSEIKDKSEIVKKAIPQNKEDERFYFQIETIAQSYGIIVNSIDIDANGGAVDEFGQPILSVYNSRNYAINLTCNYVSLSQFLAELQNAIRLTSVEKLDIRQKDGSTIDVTVSATAYDSAQGETNGQL